MNTTFKELVASNLLATCQETTINMANKIKEAKIDEDNPRVKELREVFQMWSAHWTSETSIMYFKGLAKILKEPLLERITISKDINNIIYDPFTVATIINYSDNSIKPNDKFIIINGKNKAILDKMGFTGERVLYNIMSQVRLATPNEIMSCIQELNDAQWKTIMTNELFAPIVNAAWNTPVKIAEDQLNIESEDSGE